MTRKKKPSASLVRSSAAEYLTFVEASGTGGVEAIYADESRFFESDFDRVVAETKRLGEGAAQGPSRRGRKP